MDTLLASRRPGGRNAAAVGIVLQIASIRPGGPARL